MAGGVRIITKGKCMQWDRQTWDTRVWGSNMETDNEIE